ncbi:MAG: cytochrome b/b6 domain-containing protein [Deltaproteobacteria bacterium]|nr:cytochrome b/b6 domain-containing protein [Deltaproteobacteria bacterium]
MTGRTFWKWFRNLLALLILFQIGLGWYMTDLGFYHRWYHAAPSLHKSVGSLVMFTALIRLIFRFRENFPSPGLIIKSLRFNVFGAQHYLLYTFVLLITTTGYLFSTSKGDPISFFGLIDLPSLLITGDSFRNVLDWIHYLLAYTLAGGILVHSVQMKHNFSRKRSLKK